MTKPSAIGFLLGKALGMWTLYVILRRLEAPKWCAYSVALIVSHLDGIMHRERYERVRKTLGWFAE